MKRTMARGLVAVLVFLLLPSSGQAQDPLVVRDVEPVILTGADVPAWSGPAAVVACQPWPSGALIGERSAHNGIVTAPPAIGTPVDEIAAFRWDGSAFVEIPVQVDERFDYCLSNPPSDFGLYSGTDKELTYAWDIETWMKTEGECAGELPAGPAATPDPVPTLDDDDEIVFMASDTGTLAPPDAAFPPDVASLLAILLADALDPATLRVVYLARIAGGSSFAGSSVYVDYQRDPDADEWIDRYSIARDDPETLGVSNTGYGPNLAGTVCRTAAYPGHPVVPDGVARPSDDRWVRDGVTVSTDAYEWYASGRWMIRSMRVAKPDVAGTYGPDLIDRWKGRAFQQSPDSTISLVGFEDEQVNWEANSALLGERKGPVRAIREVWGADSGTNVTKTETFYRDVIAYRYHVRVHPIPPDGLYTSWDYNAHVADRYYNTIKPDGVPIDGVNDDTGNVDGAFGFPAFFDVPDPTFNVPTSVLNWEQVSGVGDSGSLVYIIEMKGATTLASPAVVPYYRDDACLDDGTGDDPVARPWPGETSTDQRVRDGYSAAAGGTPYEELTCEQRSGLWGGHGVHYFVTGDTDNAFSPLVLDEIDAQQWQFAVPTAAPAGIGQRYGNVIVAPLQPAAIPLAAVPPPPDTPDAPPSAASAEAATDEDVPVEVLLSGGDLDTCELTFTIVGAPGSGALGAIANGACTAGTPNADAASVTYTPNANFSGTDSFTYRTNDGTSDSAVATVTITVRPEPPLCSGGPVEDCKQPSQAGAASLGLSDEPADGDDDLSWKWLKGTATSLEELGDPRVDTRYELCVYDAASPSHIVVSERIPEGDMCGEDRPCWKASKKGFKYDGRRSEGRPEGSPALKLTLMAGERDGRAKILVGGRGHFTGLSDSLPLTQPVIVQLKNSEGSCWEATYSGTPLANDEEEFRADSD